LAALFTVTIFLSASLLFLVQPMVAKMILPSFGGAPAVWNAAMVFFQGALLAGYGYAHLSTKWLGIRTQQVFHVGLLVACLLLLPVAMRPGYNPAETGLPMSFALLALLGVLIGLPFFAVSAGAPLIQRWFAETGHPRAKDPYFLYAASNLGSMLALLAYPFVLEPRMRLAQQSELWLNGFRVLLALMALCALASYVWRRSHPAEGGSDEAAGAPPSERPSELEMGPPIPWARRGKWVLLAAIPSSLMLGVTTYLTTNVTPMPLLWVVPLAIYLLTFVSAFSRVRLPADFVGRFAALFLAPMAIVIVQESSDPIELMAIIHLTVFTLAALYCHTRIADDRPPAGRLTEFYFWLALGGVVGGAFNGLLAPVAFNTLAEYPLAYVLLLAIRPGRPGQERPRLWDFLYPAFVAGATIGAVHLAEATHKALPNFELGIKMGLPCLLAFVAVDRPLRYALSLGAFFLVSGFLHTALSGKIPLTDRSFFGVHRVLDSDNFNWRSLLHGNTIHGRQFLDPGRQGEPLTYYSRKGPIGQILEAMNDAGRVQSVAMVGLGVGSITAYARPGQRYVVYEIDPLVVSIARESGLFTFLRDARSTPEIVLGDARLSLAKAPSESYDVIVLDAFSSDAIPVHLLTREAIELYLHKLRPGGVLAFHVSNRYLDLTQPLAYAARDLGLAGVRQYHVVADEDESQSGATDSHWLLLARNRSDIPFGETDARWQPLMARRPGHAWTDDFSDIVGAFGREPN